MVKVINGVVYHKYLVNAICSDGESILQQVNACNIQEAEVAMEYFVPISYLEKGFQTTIKEV